MKGIKLDYLTSNKSIVSTKPIPDIHLRKEKKVMAISGIYDYNEKADNDELKS